MPDRLQLQHLVRADRAVKRGRMHIQEKEERIARLERQGLATSRERSLLQTWRGSQKLHEADLTLIEADIKGDPT